MTRFEAASAEQVAAFEVGVEKLCREIGVYVDHEDGHGAGRVYDAQVIGRAPACEIYWTPGLVARRTKR